MLKRVGLPFTVMLLILLAGGACNPKSSGELGYTAPFETGITTGNFLPGTELQYTGIAADGRAEIYIKGQRALKQKADSISWQGEVSKGVAVELDLRVLWFDEATLHVGGTAKIDVTAANVRGGQVPEKASLTFGNAPVAYTVQKGETIPGTLLTFEGKTQEGAKLGGIDDYPYRKGGDSIVWTGFLQENMWLRLDLRVGIYTDSTLAVAGLASLWIEP